MKKHCQLSLILMLCLSLYQAQASDAKAMHHHHTPVDVAAFTQIPEVSLQVQRDAVSGWNIHITTTYFRLAPEHVNQSVLEGEGHAHLYVDGEKIARLYGTWFHLDNLAEGEHTIKVTLNANNHAPLALNGEIIAARQIIIQ